MRTIAVIARKGGSGKTTVAINVGVAAHRRGLNTLFADSDPQRSLADVLKGRRHAEPPVVETTGPGLLALQIASRRAGVETLVIDTAAGKEEDFSHSIVLADLLLIVVRPTLLDFAALVRTLTVIRRLGKRAMVVLNQAPPRRSGIEPPAVRKALDALRLLKLPVSPAILRTRAVYQSAIEKGSSVEEQLTDVAAAAEISELWSSVQKIAFAPQYSSFREPAGDDFITGNQAIF